MRAPVEQVLDLLRTADIEVLGLLRNASNYTFAVKVTGGGVEAVAVYKPERGETPLWDFPEGTLWRREIAAYEMSAALGWDLVPPTVRRDGPHGVGSLQLFVDAVPDQHYFTMMDERAGEFRRVAAFDVVINNADRKAGHCLLEEGTGRLWVIDHGVTFHAEPKLRTVVWEHVGEPLDPAARADLERVVTDLDAGGPVSRTLRGLLAADEVDATCTRIKGLLAAGVLPAPDEHRRSFPWPPV